MTFAHTPCARQALKVYRGSPEAAHADLRQAAVLAPRNAYAALWLELARWRDGSPGGLAEDSRIVEMSTWPGPVVDAYLGRGTMDAARAAAREGKEPSRRLTGADVAAAADAARHIAAERGGFYVDQFHASEGVRAHREGTGPEIWAQCGGRVDAWVACVGTGATFLGVAAALRDRNPAIVCAAVEPAGSRPLAGLPISEARHVLQGTGYGSVPPHWKIGLMDLALAVTDEEAERWRRVLAMKEGLHVGFSAAANVCAAAALLASGRLLSDAVVITVLCDTGLKY